MPTVQIFTGFRAEKRWGGVSFVSLPESSLAHIGGGCSRMERSKAIAQTCAFSPPPPGWLDRIWGAGPPSPCGEPGPARSLRRLPAAEGGAPLGPAPSSLPPLLSLLGQKLGPRGGSSSCLPSKAEAPLGYGRGG